MPPFERRSRSSTYASTCFAGFLRHIRSVWRTNWIKAALSLTGICTVLVLLDAAGDIVSAVLYRLSATQSAWSRSGAMATNSFPAEAGIPSARILSTAHCTAST
ncbi:hypothetical protein C6376_40525 [Streptomyces sp. P3]|nr:hypothetical protein C6376_40525 [Streptomyces sp. P3]